MSVSALLLDPATKHRVVKDRVASAWNVVQRGEFVLCIGLRRLFLDHVHRGGASCRFTDWAEEEFGIPGKLADLFSFIGSHLERLPRIRAAMESGELTYTKVREFIKLVDEENEEEWIEYAKTHTNRQLERRAERARRGTKHDTKKVVSRLTPQEVQTVRKVREVLMKETQTSVPDDKVLPRMAEAVLAGGLFGTGRGDAGGAKAKAPLPNLTINYCPGCNRTHVPVPGENLRVPVEDWIRALADGAPVHDFMSKVLCDCEELKHRRDLCPHAKPTEGPPPTSRHVPADVRRRVEARDGFRCRTPGCGCGVPLEIGHIRPYRDGTPMLEEFLVQQCATCNDLIETGRLVVKGEAPFERYYRADGTFIGYGYDPDPHVGVSRDPPEEAPGDPPEGSRKGV